jgi:hypothetical protein
MSRIMGSVQKGKSQRDIQNDQEKMAKAHRKKMSEDRKNRWPNTLEAIRHKKDSAMKIREDKLEVERQEVDRQEALLQKNKRMEAIERANSLLYEQTDKMKALRSQQLYSDVLQDRELQVYEKQVRKSMVKKREDHYYEIQKKLVAEGDRKEMEEEQKRQTQSALIAAQQQEQLQVFKETYIKSLRNDKAEGLAIKKKVESDLLKEKEEAARRRREAKQAALDTKIANEQLKEIRNKMLEQEVEEDQIRKRQAAEKEHMENERKKQEAIRFKAKLDIKQRMIDAATEQLKELSNQTDEREANQAAEVKAAEDAEMAARQARRDRQQAAIHRSRQLQLRMKKETIEATKEGGKRLAAHYQQRNRQVQEEEQAENLERIARNVKVRKEQEKQVDERRRIKMEERARQLLADEQTRRMMDEEDSRFFEIANEELREAKLQGKNVICIGKAVNAKDKQIMAAGGTRV